MSRHHIRKREGKNGSAWYATVELSRDPLTGKRRQKHVSGPTRKGVEAEVARIIDLDDRGQLAVDSKLTVAEYLQRWHASIEPTLKPTTWRRYEQTIRLRLTPMLGQHQLARLTPLVVQGFATDLVAQCRSQTTANYTFTVLSVALNQAVRWGLIPANVCRAVTAPKTDTPEMKTWSAEEASAFLEQAVDHPLEALWKLALSTGMRRGEMVGLRWQDVDLERGVLSVRHTLVQGPGKAWESSTPKTKAGRRSIALGTEMVDALKRHRDRQRLARTPNPMGLVFITTQGRPIHQNTINGQLARLTALAKVPTIRFHDLRHTCATLLMANGVHPKMVQERLGHSAISITLDRYSHVTESMQQPAADKIDDLLKRRIQG